MSEIHNLQIMFTQMPNVNKIMERVDNSTLNGAQIINVVNLNKDDKKTSQVSQVSESTEIQKENKERKRGEKTGLKQKIDLYG